MNENGCCKKTSIGGQALLEGIMMRGPERTAMAVRDPAGEIVLEAWDTGKPFGGKLAAEKRKSVYKSIKSAFGGVNGKYAEEFIRGGNAVNGEIFSLLERDEGKEDEKGEGEEELVKFWIETAASILPRIGNENAELKRAVGKVAEGNNDYAALISKFLKKSERLKSFLSKVL